MHFIRNLFLLLLLPLLLFLNIVVGTRFGHMPRSQTTSTLYTGNEPVVQLHGSNFTALVSGSQTTWAVEFYATWCGHCQRFVPTWRALATDVKGWVSVVRVAAVACSHPDNVDICRHYEVDSYPAIKLFAPGAVSLTPTGQRYAGAESLSELRMAIVDFAQSVEEPPVTWPDLQPLPNLLSLIKAVESERRMAFVIFEDNEGVYGEDKYLARETILDLSTYTEVAVGRMDSRAAGANHGVTVFPSLCRVHRDASLSMCSASMDRHQFGDVIRQTAQLQEDPMANTVMPTQSAVTTVVVPVIPRGVHIQDLESSVFYSLWQEVARHDTIDSEKMVALQRHVAVMAKYYPGPEHTVLFLERLHQWLHGQRTLNAGDWLQNLNRLQSTEAYVPHRVIWTGCQGSQPQYRGYPCSLWTTYHVLTVQAYLSQSQQAAREVLHVMRGFVQHFLSCRECVENFAKMAVEIDSISDNQHGVLWLWRAHNRANLRLHSDVTEDKRHPKVQFPVYSACAECHVTRPVSDFVVSEWNETSVLQYLVKFYSENIVDDSLPYTYVETQQKKEHREKIGDHINGGSSLYHFSNMISWILLYFIVMYYQ